MDFNYSHIQIIIILITLVVGYVVWTYNTQSYLNKILTFIIICIVLIDISLLFHLKIEGRRFLGITIVLGSLGISFFTPLVYTLSLYYPIKKQFKRSTLYTIYGITVLLSVLIIISFPRNYILEKLPFPTELRHISFKNLPLVFILLYFLLTSFSMFLIFLSTKNFLSSFKEDIIPYEKNTLRFLIMVGIPLASILSVVSVINYFFTIPFPWMGFFVGIFSPFIVILIFRFHLIDLKRFIYGIIFFPALIAILVFVYISLILKNQSLVSQIMGLPESVTLILEVYLIYLIVSTLRRFRDIPLFKRKFLNILIWRSSDIEPLEFLSYAVNIKDLYGRLKEVFRISRKIDRVWMLLYNDELGLFENVEGYKEPSLSGSSEIVKALEKLNRGVTLEELLIYINDREDIQYLHSHGINLILPIKREEKVSALIMLPRLGVMENWSYDDIRNLNYLRIIMPSLISRCIMYENEKKIEQHQARMEQLNVMGQMASGLAHEIRNPLSIIATSVETVLQNEIDEQNKIKMLQYIQEEASRINILVDKLLSVNFDIKPQFGHVDLLSIFYKIKSFLQYKLKDSGISYIVENSQKCIIYTDGNMLFQVLLNLALNSIEALKGGGTIKVNCKHKVGKVDIYFADNGPGIPTRIKDRVFEPFFTTKPKGSGLGLTVTKKLVEKLYGGVELMPSREGCLFRITLPKLKVSECTA